MRALTTSSTRSARAPMAPPSKAMKAIHERHVVCVLKQRRTEVEREIFDIMCKDVSGHAPKKLYGKKLDLPRKTRVRIRRVNHVKQKLAVAGLLKFLTERRVGLLGLRPKIT